jgi:predicted transcriptional regulator
MKTPPRMDTTVLSVRVAPGLAARLQRYANADRRSVSAVIGLAIEDFLERHKPIKDRTNEKA